MKLATRKPLLTAAQEYQLALRVHQAQDPADSRAARDELILCNLGLVGKAARWHIRRRPHLDHDDLWSEGMLALLRAAELYEPWTSTARFATYATRAISNALSEWVESDRPVTVPKWVQDPNQVQAKLAAVDRRTPKRARSLYRCLECSQAARSRVYSLSLTPDPDADNDCLSIAPIDSQPTADEAFLRAESTDRLRAALGQLRPFQAYILMHRYGLGSAPQLTLRELSKSSGLSRERIRQVEAAAIARLRRILEETQGDTSGLACA